MLSKEEASQMFKEQALSRMRGLNIKTPGSDDWCTPPWLFQALDTEFSFTLDGAANEDNTHCTRWNGLGHPTTWGAERVFCNPPYSDIEPFLHMADITELAVFLLPVRTDSDWFHQIIARDFQLRWFRKRIDFWLDGKPMGSPRFSSFLAILDNR